MNAAIPAIPVRAQVLSPFAYHSLSLAGGTATIAEFLGDRAIAFAMMAALGGLWASGVMPARSYREHMARLPWLSSVFSTEAPALLRPLTCRLNLDTEGGLSKRIIDATSTGNLKTFFTIQEVAPGVVYHGAVFGADPFDLASRAEGRSVDELVIRVGLRRAGLIRLTPWKGGTSTAMVRLNAATARLFDDDLPQSDPEYGKVDRYVLHDMQVTRPMPIKHAANLVGRWRPFPAV